MLVPKQKNICSHSLNKNGSQLPEKKNLIVPNHQHDRHDVTCNQPIGFYEGCPLLFLTCGKVNCGDRKYRNYWNSMNMCGVCHTFKDCMKVFLELTLFFAAEYLAMKDQMLITLYTSTGLIWCEQVY